MRKSKKENQQIPIIFLTASDEEVSIIRGLDSGAGRLYHQVHSSWGIVFPHPGAVASGRSFQKRKKHFYGMWRHYH